MKKRFYFPVLCFVLPLVFSCGGNTRADAERIYVAASEAYGAENLEDALDLARRALKLDGRFYQASLLEGKILFFMDRNADSQAVFARLVKKHPSYTEARIWHIRCLILKGDYAAARALLDRELSFNQTDWRIYSLYALLAQKTENYEERLAMNRRAETVLSGSTRVYLDLALAWHSLGITGRAESYLKKANDVAGSNISFRELENALAEFLQE
jgi:tetratricopeptide (TPR) repeat protein